MKMVENLLKKKVDTLDLDVKTFLDLICDQMQYGGTKYKADASGRESTDILFQVYGHKWLYGTISKYCKRILNLKRERDALKICTYLYLIWLKRGFWVLKEGIDSPALYTNVDVKVNNFSKFCYPIVKDIRESKKQITANRELCLKEIEVAESMLIDWSTKDFNNVTESEIYRMFMLVLNYWLREFPNKGQDKDTWNELTSKEGK
jgi:hypothetical protein